jgi:hypothetical protein
VWNADSFTFIDEADETHCRLMRYTIGDEGPQVVQDFPEGAGGIEFLDTESRQWLRYRLNEHVYITNIDGTVVFPMARTVSVDYTEFVELPLGEVDSRRMIVVGIGCIGVMVIGSWKMRLMDGRHATGVADHRIDGSGADCGREYAGIVRYV